MLIKPLGREQLHSLFFVDVITYPHPKLSLFNLVWKRDPGVSDPIHVFQTLYIRPGELFTSTSRGSSTM